MNPLTLVNFVEEQLCIHRSKNQLNDNNKSINIIQLSYKYLNSRKSLLLAQWLGEEKDECLQKRLFRQEVRIQDF